VPFVRNQIAHFPNILLPNERAPIDKFVAVELVVWLGLPCAPVSVQRQALPEGQELKLACATWTGTTRTLAATSGTSAIVNLLIMSYSHFHPQLLATGGDASFIIPPPETVLSIAVRRVYWPTTTRSPCLIAPSWTGVTSTKPSADNPAVTSTCVALPLAPTMSTLA
jgi:hypothetical protein